VSGVVFLVPNLLGAVPPAQVLPERTLVVARRLRHWVVETPKPARAFLKTLVIDVPIADLRLWRLPAQPTPGALAESLAPARAGNDIGVLSDAGCPGIADPGAAIVAAAHAAGMRVVPLVGPSALLLALMASGMNGQSFAFHGYLPVKAEARAVALRRIEDDSRAARRTQVFIETPYRNAAMLAALAATLRPATAVCIAADLTLPTETIERRTAREWRGVDFSRFDKRPAMFVIEA
jgi:16S rRNA (cytidine1402-2'-O)-methyltransferase